MLYADSEKRINNIGKMSVLFKERRASQITGIIITM
jgi:hypothetical protein